MATFSKDILTGSSNGRGILLSTSATPTTIHSVTTTTTAFDEIWLYGHNYDTTARKCTIQFGGTTANNDEIELTIPPESGLVLIVPGLVLKGVAGPALVRGFAATATSITIHGYVNRIV